MDDLERLYSKSMSEYQLGVHLWYFLAVHDDPTIATDDLVTHDYIYSNALQYVEEWKQKYEEEFAAEIGRRPE